MECGDWDKQVGGGQEERPLLLQNRSSVQIQDILRAMSSKNAALYDDGASYRGLTESPNAECFQKRDGLPSTGFSYYVILILITAGGPNA